MLAMALSDSLFGAGGETTDEVALEKEVDEEDRHRDDQRLGHQRPGDAQAREGDQLDVGLQRDLGDREQRRIADAEGLFREAVTASENTQANGIAHDSLARFLIREKRYDEGIEQLKLAVEAMPSHAQTQFFLGIALNSTGNFAEALVHLKQAHQLDPSNPEYLSGLATVCRDAGEFGLAIAYAEKLVRLDPASQQYQSLLGQLRAMLQQQQQQN